MKKTRKQFLAEYLMTHDESRLSAKIIAELSDQHGLGVQCKTLNSDGDFVIKFSSSDPWIRPSEWLHNYQVSVTERYEEAESVYHSLFPQEDNGISFSEDEVNEMMAKHQALKDKIARLKGYESCGFILDDEGSLIFGGDAGLKYVDAVLTELPKLASFDAAIAMSIGRAFLDCGSCQSVISETVKAEIQRRMAKLKSERAGQKAKSS